MKALILAAGLGTRLKPLTDKTPKALIEVGNKTMLERVILRLKESGVDLIVVNIHHLGEQIISFLQNKDFGIKILISDERGELLDTGGGIVKASSLLFSENNDPVLVHNVDILSNVDFKTLQEEFSKRGCDGLLIVSDRKSTRKLIFNKSLELKGWKNIDTGEIKPKNYISEDNNREYAFSGIYMLGKIAVDEMKKLCGENKFSIMDYFLHPERKSKLSGLVIENLNVLDIGKPATLQQASEILNDKNIEF